MSPGKASSSPPSPPPNPPPSRGRGERPVALAAVAGAHGVRGELRLKLFTDSIDNLKRHESVYVGGVERKLESVRAGPAGAVARVEGVADRAAAEALRGSLVEVDRSALPPLEEGEYYHTDLVGVACFDSEGNAVGRVAAVENYGAGDLLEVELPDGRRSLIPFRPGIADFDGERIVLDPAFLA